MNVEDEKLLKTLVAHRATIPTAGFRGTYAAYPRGNIRRKPVCWIEQATLDRLVNDQVLEKKGARIQVSGNVIHLFQNQPKRITHQTRADQSTEHRDIYTPDGVVRSARLRRSTLEQIARKRMPSGANFLSKAQVQAGENFARDYTRAGLGHISTQNYDWMPGGDHSSAEHALISRLDRRRRVGDAIACLGPGLERAAISICCEDWTMDQLERAEKWTKGSGAMILKLALDRLVKFYGTEPGI